METSLFDKYYLINAQRASKNAQKQLYLDFLKSVPPNSGNNNLFPDFVSGVTRRVILIYTEFGLPPKKLANIF